MASRAASPLRVAEPGAAAQHAALGLASPNVTSTTGSSSLCGKPGLRQVKSFFWTRALPSHPKPPFCPFSASVTNRVSVTKRENCARVTGTFPSQNEREMVTLRGVSFDSRPGSVVGDP